MQNFISYSVPNERSNGCQHQGLEHFCRVRSNNPAQSMVIDKKTFRTQIVQLQLEPSIGGKNLPLRNFGLERTQDYTLQFEAKLSCTRIFVSSISVFLKWILNVRVYLVSAFLVSPDVKSEDVVSVNWWWVTDWYCLN